MTSIQHFTTLPFIQALKGFFEDLHIPINILSEVPGSPSTIFKEAFNPQNPTHALMDDVYVLGTVDDMAFTQTRKINENEIKNADYDFLMIVGIVLKKDKKPTRGQLAELTRLCNKIFNSNEKGNPVTVVFRYDDCISFSNAERIVRNGNDYRDGEKLGKVSCLKDIQLTKPHAAHQRILAELSIKNSTQTFEGLYEHWRKAFDTKELNKGFFKKIANWYFWGIDQAKFPFQYLRNEEKNALKTDEQLQNIANQKALIRFITRIIFVWFLKEKKLIPETLFEEDFLKNTLKNTDNNAADYYNAILQNLFFATLNRSKDQRAFATDDGFNKNKVNYDVNSLYRYEKMFKNPDPEQIMRLFEEIPFLNGGLFDSLDNKENALLMDGFSRTKSKRAVMPDRLFFGNETTDFDVKLNEIYDTKSKKYGVKGLFQIFEEYKFTVEENTPLEIDVALDPYLLGEIFENLLAYYNPETSNTARKGTGSFYTPQEIVNYMVDESLKAYLETNVGEINAGRVLNPASVEFDVKFDENTKFKIVKALSEIKILDPACGSGAFPMGVLQRMVQLLTKLDPDNSLWRAIQKEKIIGKKIAELEADKQAIAGLSDAEVRNRAIEAVTERIREVEVIFNNEYNFDDYSRKLFIIQNCIYGVDIQDVAIQISKLRFFLSLIIDQKNEAIKPLPNLETKFVIANTLIGLNMPNEGTFTNYDPTTDKREELRKVREKYFTVTTRKAKNELKTQDANLRNDIAKLIEAHYVLKRERQIAELRTQISDWEQRLTDAQALPKEIEIMETTTLFGEKQTTKTDKTKAKIDSVKQRLNGLKIELQKIENHNEVNQIIDTAQKIAHWDIYNQNAQAQWFDMNWMFGITDGFDVVIGNPPYKVVNNNESLAFKKLDTFKTGELYAYFFEVSIKNLLKDSGVLSFITASLFIKGIKFSSLRECLTKLSKLSYLKVVGDDVFDNVQMPTAILICSKSVKHEVWTFEDLSPDYKILLKVEEKTDRLGDLIFIMRGFEIGRDKVTETGDNPFLTGSNVGKWIPKNTGYVSNDIIEEYSKDDFYFQGDRLLIRETGSEITCLFMDEFIYSSRSLYSVKSKDESIKVKFLLALINSKMFQFIYQIKYKSDTDLFPKIRISQVKDLPIKQILPEAQKPFIELVNKILSDKKAGEDTRHLEAEIDRLVYALYDLTEGEIAVVEGR